MRCINGKVEQLLCEAVLANSECRQENDKLACVAKENAECHNEMKPVCEAGRIKRCVGRRLSYERCPSGSSCQGGECKKHDISNVVECNHSLRPVCVGNSARYCENEKIVLQDCGENICKSGVCTAKPSCEQDYKQLCINNKLSVCSNGELKLIDCPENESCFVDRCIKVEATNSSCSAKSAQEYCNNNNAVNCVKNRMASTTCTDNTVCGTINNIASCAEPCSDEDLGQHRSFCEDRRAVHQSCVIAQNGVKLWETTHDVFCEHVCNSGDCVPLHEDIGKACDDTYEKNCKEGFLSLCYSGKVIAYDCGIGDRVCGDSPTEGSNCYEKCTQEGKIRQSCTYQAEGAFLGEQVCETFPNQSMGWISKSKTPCPETCAEAQCLSAEDAAYKPCDDRNYEPHCAANNLMMCYYGTIYSTPCSSTRCTLSSNNVSDCYGECEVEGAHSSSCINDLNASYSMSGICKELSDGSLGHSSDGAQWKPCPKECIDGECIKVHPSEGQSCRFASFDPFCVENALVYCAYQNSTITAVNCAVQNASCDSNMQSLAGCYISCDREGYTTKSCYYNDLVTYTCVKLKSGKLGFDLEYQPCQNGCKDNKCI
ncbi:MAG: hypothetical protein WC966_11195 [Bradymonadales bacterium]|jgi:hypothetical protein